MGTFRGVLGVEPSRVSSLVKETLTDTLLCLRGGDLSSSSTALLAFSVLELETIVDLKLIEFLLDVLQGVFKFGMVRRLVSASLIHSLVSVVPSPKASQQLSPILPISVPRHSSDVMALSLC